MLVNIEDVKPGTILENDVITNDGKLLVPAGASFSEKLRLRLLEFKIYKVSVTDDSEQIKIDSPPDHVFYTETLGKIKDTFNSIKYKKVVEISELDNIVDSLVSKSVLSSGMLSFINIMEQKDERILQHSINVSVTATLMGKWLGYSKDDIKLLGMAAILHDIGKAMIPDDVLNKRGKLTTAELNLIRDHTRLGYTLLNNSPNIDRIIKNVALMHHERINGQGYPLGLEGNNIIEMARIVSICDLYDTVTSKGELVLRVHALRGLRVIFDESYRGLDPYLCKVFLNNVSTAYCGCNVKLSSGKTGKIIRILPDKPDKPWILIDDSLVDLTVSKDLDIVDLIS